MSDSFGVAVLKRLKRRGFINSDEYLILHSLLTEQADRDAWKKCAEELAGRLGDHYCGCCGNGGEEERERPYSDVTDIETQSFKWCRPTLDTLAAYDALKGES